MKVTSQSTTSASTTGTTSAQELQKAGGSSPASTQAAAGSDRVELSSTLGSLSRAMESYSSSRAAHVQAIAAQYQSGNYQANSAATSRGLVSEALGG